MSQRLPCPAGMLISGHGASQRDKTRKKQAHSLVTRVYDHDGRETRSAHCPATPHVHAACRIVGVGRRVPVGGISALPDPLGHPGPVHARLVSPR